MNVIEKMLGSGFFTGYIPFASGTWGSLAALLIYWIPGFETPLVIIPAIIIFTVYGIIVAGKFEKAYGKDPSQCTIDEVAGTWISLLFLPKTITVSIITFLFWRVLDIFKPFPANRFEKIPGGLGIMADDLMSGFYACCSMHLLLKLFF